MSDLMTFIGGAAVGTLVTYLAKNEDARKTAERFIDGMGLAFTDFLHRMTPDRVKQNAESEFEPESKATEKPAAARKPIRGRKAAKAKKAGSAEKPVH